MGVGELDPAATLEYVRAALQVPAIGEKPPMSMRGMVHSRLPEIQAYLDERAAYGEPLPEEVEQARIIADQVADEGLLPEWVSPLETVDDVAWRQSRHLPVQAMVGYVSLACQRALAHDVLDSTQWDAPRVLAYAAGESLVMLALQREIAGEQVSRVASYYSPFEVARLRYAFPPDTVSETNFWEGLLEFPTQKRLIPGLLEVAAALPGKPTKTVAGHYRIKVLGQGRGGRSK